MKVCNRCKGTNILQMYWVDPNTKKINDPVNPADDDSHQDKWCEDCEQVIPFTNE